MPMYRFLVTVAILSSVGCRQPDSVDSASPDSLMAKNLAKYVPFRLEVDAATLSPSERKMLPLLIEAAEEMDRVFWKQAFGDREALRKRIDDDATWRFCEINYGPWDRLDGNQPFVAEAGPKPPGAGFYPTDMTREEFEKHIADHPDEAEEFRSLYTVILREADGRLRASPYHEAFGAEFERAAAKLEDAAVLADDESLARYLRLRAKALRTSDYLESDLAWMDMKTNRIDVVIGPIETYEDKLYGNKAAATCYVLVKDMEWSARLARYATFLPELQRGLPVPPEYKKESPGTDSELNAYDAIYYSGDCNSGSKTIAINLPNDERVQLQKGTRRLQLKNAMRAKFDRILVPIADVLIATDQRKHITFDAFFSNTMFHEIAHGLGIKNTVNGKGTVREALAEESGALEEGKADVLGLYMVSELIRRGEVQADLLDHHVTFLAGIFRSVRFGAASAHGRANMLRFNFFREQGAFSLDEATGTYKVDSEKMAAAVESLSRRILTLQGDGDRAGVKALMAEKGGIGPTLAVALERLTSAGIPVDIVFEQGLGE